MRLPLVLGFVVCLGLLGWGTYRLKVLQGRLTAMETLMEAPQTKADTWKWGEACITHTVTTNQQPEESQEDFCDRHDAAVRRDLATYEPNTECN